MPKLFAVPMSLKKANNFVEDHHRHNGRTARDGGKWAIGVSDGERLIGVAIVGNPLSATYMDGYKQNHQNALRRITTHYYPGRLRQPVIGRFCGVSWLNCRQKGILR